MAAAEFYVENLDPASVVAVARHGARVTMGEEARKRVGASRGRVEIMIEGTLPVYGVTTGFGALANTRITADKRLELQHSLLRSHAAGMGEFVEPEVVRAMMVIRAKTLSAGYSGVRPELIDALVTFLNADLTPAVPEYGSMGASGDLAPLAHVGLCLVGEGRLLERGEPVQSRGAMERAGIRPIRLATKEGLALINGTQPSTAVTALACTAAETLARSADVAAALSIDALQGSLRPFDARIHDARPHSGQRIAAANVLTLLSGSAINKSHEHCGRVQDAYSLRCAAQVHGAARDALSFVRQTLSIEANGATDNPMVFGEDDDIVSGGNFHGAPVAIAADLLAIAVTQLATISERRSDRLVDPALSGLPPFLTTESGVQSGYMMAQVTAAALASELKTLAHPASVDTIPTSANREDHVSMSMGAALKAEAAVALAVRVIAVEVLCACQALDLLVPLRTSAALQRVHDFVRSIAAPLAADRPPSRDIEEISRTIRSGEFVRACGAEVK